MHCTSVLFRASGRLVLRTKVNAPKPSKFWNPSETFGTTSTQTCSFHRHSRLILIRIELSTLPSPSQFPYYIFVESPPINMAATIAPNQMGGDVQFRLVNNLDNPDNCTCGWYVYYSSICGHEYQEVPYRCVARTTPSGKSGFCKVRHRKISSRHRRSTPSADSADFQYLGG